MKVTIDPKRNIMTIEIALQEPAPSTSGKTLVIATTHGFAATDATYKGKVVSLSMNATISAK